MNNSLNGIISVPGDKSISHRSIIFGAISKGTTRIKNFLESADCLSTIQVFRQLGIQIKNDKKMVEIKGLGINGLNASPRPLNMGNSGTSTRLISGLLAGQPFFSNICGDKSLSNRPMKRIIDPLTEMGANIESANYKLPMTIHGTQLKGIKYTLPVASAQVKSSIILAALQANSSTVITEPVQSRDHTERMLFTFSPSSIETNANQIIIHPDQDFKAQEINVPGDISSAAFFIVAATIIPHSKVTIKNVGINPTRIGILNVLKRAGAKLKVNKIDSQTEPSANITVESAKLIPFTVKKSEIPGLIDEIPLLALLAACADGTSKITGAEELRFKESDRLAVITTEFKKLGIAIKELPNGFIIDGSREWKLQSTHLDSHKDHRIAMTLKIASLLINEPIKIKDFDSIKISYPTFDQDLKKLRS